MLSIASFMNKSAAFELSRMTISVRGVMGVGKSTFTAIMVRELLEIERRPVYVWIREFKLPDTLPIYERQLGTGEFSVKTRTLIPANLERLKHTIVVIEDAPSWLSTRSKDAMECLVSSYARANDTLAIIVSQKPQSLPTALTFELSKKEGQYLYRAIEERRASSWMNWTNANHLDAVEFVLKGVKGQEVGRRGHTVNHDSKRQRAFKMFDEGASNREVEEALDCSNDLVRWYRWQWRKLQHLNTNKRLREGRINLDKRKRRWKKVGWRLELMVVEALKELGFHDVFWNQRADGADVILTVGGIEIECKRHRKTRYVTTAWLKEHVLSRYSENAAVKILVVTKANWNWEGEELLRRNGIGIIEVGCIDRPYQLERAKETFKEEFGRITVFEAIRNA